jgi:HSP20 family protein
MNQHPLATARHPLAGLMDSFFADTLPEAFPGATAPATDIAETATTLVLSLELPGIAEQDVTIEIHDRNLKISAERKLADQPEGLRWHRREQRFGKRARTIVLPETANCASVDAKLEHGVLTITVQKHEKPQPVRVPIRAT